jgi:acyl-ACP thioesterase
MSDTIHREGFRVASNDVDPAERLAPRALCGFLQETAGRDVARRGFGMRLLIDGGLAWVLQRLTVEVAGWPQVGDEIVVETRARGFTRAVAERDFRVRDVEGRELARATAAGRWSTSGPRPVRPPRRRRPRRSAHAGAARGRLPDADPAD